MQLIIYYVVFMISGDFAAYFIGLFVEYEWGSHASLIVAVWATEPKKANPAASNEQDAGSAGPG